MRIRMVPSLVTAFVVVTLTAAQAHAQDTFARSYTVTPKDGMVAQFESALKAHLEWREANGDPWSWSVSTVEVGENLGEYRIRSSGHTWADFDAYDADFAPEGLVQWNASVASLVKSISSNISTTNSALSKPFEGESFAFVNVTRFNLRPGYEQQFTQAVSTAHAALTEHNFGGNYVWIMPVSGSSGPSMTVVTLHASWADMAEPDPGFEAIMMEELGEDGFMEWAEAIGSSHRSVENYTLRRRPDLDVN